MQEHYKTLNISANPSITEIKKASRKLLLKYHPDLHPNNKVWAQEKTKKILNAYTLLVDDAKKGQISFKTVEEIKKQKQPTEVKDSTLMRFSINEITFAVTTEEIRKIIATNSIKITKIANLSGIYPFIIGVINHQGTIVPVLNLAQKLGIDEAIKKFQILICEKENQPMALIIDKASGIINIKDSIIKENSEIDNSLISYKYVSSVVNHQDQLTHILSLKNIMIY